MSVSPEHTSSVDLSTTANGGGGGKDKSEKRSGSRKRKSEEPGRSLSHLIQQQQQQQVNEQEGHKNGGLNGSSSVSDRLVLWNKVMAEVDSNSPVVWPSWCYGSAENGQEDDKPTINNNNSSGLNLNEKPSKRRRKEIERETIKVERSSPSDSVQSDSEAKRSPPPPAMPRNYSDFMRSLAAKYNNQAPVEPAIPAQSAAAAAALFSRQQQLAAAGFQKQPLIDMSSATALLQLVRSADLKKYHQSPLDLTSGGNAVTPPTVSNLSGGDVKSSRTASNNNSKDCCNTGEVTAILGWSVDEVCRFVGSIDLCKEYVDAFRSQSIDGSGVPLLTEEHLIAMGMKLGPALKFLSVLKRKLGNCIICQHCPHCHNSSNSNSTNGSNNNNSGAVNGNSDRPSSLLNLSTN